MTAPSKRNQREPLVQPSLVVTSHVSRCTRTHRPLAVSILADVAALLAAGQSCVVLALTDLRRIVMGALEEVKVMGGGTTAEGAHTDGGAAPNATSLTARTQASGPSTAPAPSKAAAAAATPGAPAATQASASDRALRQRRRALQAAAMKLWYFMCWANGQGQGQGCDDDVVQALAVAAAGEHRVGLASLAHGGAGAGAGGGVRVR